MIRSALATAFAAATLFSAQAEAASVTYTYAGTVTDVYDYSYTGTLPTAGETVTGSLTVTFPDTWNYYFNTDDSSYIVAEAANVTDMFSGSLSFSDGSTYEMSSSYYSMLGLQLLRDYLGFSAFTVGLVTDDGVSSAYSLTIGASDQDGAASTLFVDPAGGLSFDQAINLDGETTSGDFQFRADDGSAFEAVFTLTGFTLAGSPVASTVPEPANIALLLAGVGLVGLRARRRQPAQA